MGFFHGCHWLEWCFSWPPWAVGIDGRWLLSGPLGVHWHGGLAWTSPCRGTEIRKEALALLPAQWGGQVYLPSFAGLLCGLRLWDTRPGPLQVGVSVLFSCAPGVVFGRFLHSPLLSLNNNKDFAAAKRRPLGCRLNPPSQQSWMGVVRAPPQVKTHFCLWHMEAVELLRILR